MRADVCWKLLYLAIQQRVLVLLFGDSFKVAWIVSYSEHDFNEDQLLDGLELLVAILEGLDELFDSAEALQDHAKRQQKVDGYKTMAWCTYSIRSVRW